MNRKRKSPVMRVVIVLLCVILVQAGLELNSAGKSYETRLSLLKEKYHQRKYKELIIEIERILNEIGEEQGQLRGEFFILLGAAYEKIRNKDSAVENYLLGDMLLDQPVLEGIDFRKMEIYQSTFHGKIINGRRVFEKVGKRKRKKRFPYLAVLGAAVIGVAVFLLMKKRTREVPENPEELAALEVFNSIEWIDIPAGEFMMGDVTGTGESDERPVHTVYLNNYKISKYEITWGQFRQFMNYNQEISTYAQGSSDVIPVVRIRKDTLDLFCEWMRDYSKKQVYLPTEAQWEKAARGTDIRIYPWGNTPPDCTITNFNNCLNRPQPVGSYPGDISFYGVMDMGGNVAEIVRDFYQEDYYSISPYTDPTGPEASERGEIIIRGGSWSSSDTRVSNRVAESRFSGYYNYHIGFRLVWVQ